MLRNQISKQDWTHFKLVRERTLDRLCERALDALAVAASDTSKTAHERFRSVYSEINEYNEQIAAGFDGLSRSRMLFQLAFMQSLGLLQDDDLAGFTPETQEWIANCNSRA